MKKIYGTIVLLVLCTALAVVCFQATTSSDTAWPEAPPFTNTGKAILVASPKVYKAGDKQVICEWNNGEDQSILYGQSFLLHKKVEGTWRVAQHSKSQEVVFDLIGYPLAAGGTAVQGYSLIQMIDRLTPGEYRIATDYMLNDSGENRQVVAEFTVE